MKGILLSGQVLQDNFFVLNAVERFVTEHWWHSNRLVKSDKAGLLDYKY